MTFSPEAMISPINAAVEADRAAWVASHPVVPIVAEHNGPSPFLKDLPDARMTLIDLTAQNDPPKPPEPVPQSCTVGSDWIRLGEGSPADLPTITTYLNPDGTMRTFYPAFWDQGQVIDGNSKPVWAKVTGFDFYGYFCPTGDKSKFTWFSRLNSTICNDSGTCLDARKVLIKQEDGSYTVKWKEFQPTLAKPTKTPDSKPTVTRTFTLAPKKDEPTKTIVVKPSQTPQPTIEPEPEEVEMINQDKIGMFWGNVLNITKYVCGLPLGLAFSAVLLKLALKHGGTIAGGVGNAAVSGVQSVEQFAASELEIRRKAKFADGIKKSGEILDKLS
jgi:hypothetical protein